jgi:hypothetical protein
MFPSVEHLPARLAETSAPSRMEEGNATIGALACISVPGHSSVDNCGCEQANCCILKHFCSVPWNANSISAPTSELMTAPQRVSYRMESTLESVNKSEEMADQQAARAGLDEDTRGGFSMAVREAMINAVLHGNAYDTPPSGST